MKSIQPIPKEKVLNVVSSFFKVDLWDRTRKREVVFPRQVAMSLLYVFTDMGLKKIAEEFGTDHATVLYSRNTVWGLCRHYPEIRKQVIEIESQLE